MPEFSASRADRRSLAFGGIRMSAVGKLDIYGDFDENGQLVETPYRPQLVEAQCRRAQPESRSPLQARIWTKPAPQPPNPAPLARKPIPADLRLDRSRDALLTAFGKATLTDRYLLPGESFQDMFARVSCAYADDVEPRPAPLRLHEPALVHAGDAGPVQWRHRRAACRSPASSTTCRDSLDGIVGTWNENVCAGLQRRRHRHLLGQGPLDRREGEGRRPDQRHHPLHPGDGRR